MSLYDINLSCIDNETYLVPSYNPWLSYHLIILEFSIWNPATLSAGSDEQAFLFILCFCLWVSSFAVNKEKVITHVVSSECFFFRGSIPSLWPFTDVGWASLTNKCNLTLLSGLLQYTFPMDSSRTQHRLTSYGEWPRELGVLCEGPDTNLGQRNRKLFSAQLMRC